jgi:hypothetical protein
MVWTFSRSNRAKRRSKPKKVAGTFLRKVPATFYDSRKASIPYLNEMGPSSIAGIDSIRKLCATLGTPVFYDASIMNPEVNPTRTLTLVLPEADWKALREAEPDAIGWLRAQIQNRLSASGAVWQSPNPTSTAEWNEDEY